MFLFDFGSKSWWGGVLFAAGGMYVFHHFVRPLPGGKTG